MRRILHDGYWLFISLCNLTGKIPSHRIRNFLYRRLFSIKLSPTATVYGHCRFWQPWKVSIGDNSVLGDRLFLDGRNGITIGDNVSIGGETAIFTLEHDIDSESFGTKGGPVVIQNHVYIGSRVMILPNVTVEEGAVIASGSVVTRDVAKWRMVGGIPARYIRLRKQSNYEIQHRRAILQ